MLALKKIAGCTIGKIESAGSSLAITLLVFWAGTVGSFANPYADYLNNYFATPPATPSMPTVTTPLPSTWDAWQCRSVAQDMTQRAWALCDPKSTATNTEITTLQSNITMEMTWLISAQNTSSSNTGCWWWSGCGFTGDDNVNRFVLSEVLDTIYRLKSAGQLSSSTPGWLTSLQPAVTFQYTHYGAGVDGEGPTPGTYPNMDAAYALIMGLAGNLYSNTNYTNSAHTIAVDIENAVQSGGSIPYIVGDNAAPVYTPTVIYFLSRYYDYTGDSAASSAMIAMKPYFPRALLYPGIPEYSSAPWWKHFGGQAINLPGYEDVIAGISSDPENAYLAQQLINLSLITPVDALIASDYWASITGTVPKDNEILTDSDIGGSRGRFGKFGWVTSFAPGQDTFAGAITTTTNFVGNSSLEVLGTNGLPSGFNISKDNGSPSFAMVSPGHTGSMALEITCGTNDRGEMLAPRYPLVPGQQYTMSVWYQAQTGITADDIYSRLMLWHVPGSSNESDKVSWSGVTLTSAPLGVTTMLSDSNRNLALVAPDPVSYGSWQQMSLTFVAPANAIQISLECFNAYGNGSVYYDDLSFVQDTTNGTSGSVAFDASLVLVSPEVGIGPGALNTSAPLCNQAAYLSTVSYPKNIMVSAYGDFAVSGVYYSPCKPAQPPTQNTPTHWQVNESWLALPDHLIGRVNMTSLTTHTDPWVRMRLTTEPLGFLTETNSSTFHSNSLNLNLLANNFPTEQVRQAEISDLGTTAPDADELVLSTPTTSFNANQTYYDVALNAQPNTATTPTGYQTLTSGTLMGYRVTADANTHAYSYQNTYDVWYNPTTSNASLSDTLPTSSNQTADYLYVSGTTTNPQIVNPSSVTSGTASATLPAGGTACVVVSPNLIVNPGFEELNGSGVPVGHALNPYNGSPVFAVDHTVTHTGQNSVSITCTTNDRGEDATTRVNSTGGKTYTVTVWYQTSGSGMTTTALQTRLIAWAVANGTQESQKVPWQSSWITNTTGCTTQVQGNNLAVFPTSTSSGQWASFSITFALPSTAIQLSEECFNWYGNGTVWYDDLAVVNAP